MPKDTDGRLHALGPLFWYPRTCGLHFKTARRFIQLRFSWGGGNSSAAFHVALSWAPMESVDVLKTLESARDTLQRAVATHRILNPPDDLQ